MIDDETIVLHTSQERLIELIQLSPLLLVGDYYAEDDIEILDAFQFLSPS